MTTKIPVELSSTPGIVDGSNATAITIDSSENVGIGNTSPSNALTVGSTSVTTSIISVVGSSSGFPQIRFSDDASESGQGRVFYDSANDGMGFSTASTERIRIDSAGVVDIKSGGSASTPSLIFEGDTDTGFFHGTNVLAIATAGSERARIDSSGNFIVGKTSAAAAGAGIYLGASGASFYTVDSSGAANTLHVYDNVDSAYRFYVRATGSSAGTIYATVTSIASASDERLKENIKDLETGITEIMALKPRRFDWKEGEGNNTKNNAGFIAQEIETVLPELIGDYEHEGLDDVKSVRMGDILPTLVKAVQEQQALIETQQTTIDDLKSRIETLEVGE